MTYHEAISYLYDRLPVFHRVGVSAYKPGLANVLALCEALGQPQYQFKTIHVGGTNGKGSTSHLLASIYQSAGYRVGLYTSPHLTSFTERIRINGNPIPEVVVAHFIAEQQSLIERIQPSFFEVTVALAFDFFARQEVDLAIIEVGLGGRLDSTNIINPLVSLITNIGWDHMDLLGNTLPLIAAEKAGIIKPNIPVVVGETQPETRPVFVDTAVRTKSALVFADQQWEVTDLGLREGSRRVSCRLIGDHSHPLLLIDLPLLGLYQLANLKTALSAVNMVQELVPVAEQAIREGCRLVVSQTGLKGRFQWLRQIPRVVADTAHNKPGIQALLSTMETIVYTHLRIVAGFVRDKDVLSVLQLLPAGATYYFCEADSPRALPTAELVTQAHSVGLSGLGYANVNEALAAAVREAAATDFILVTGSTYVVAELHSL